MPDTLNAAPEQAVIQSPMPDNGFDVLSTIFKDPVKPSELKRDADPKLVKEALGDKFDDGSTPEKKEEDEEKEFTKEFEKKEESENDKNDPEAKPKDDEKKEETKPELGQTAQTEDEDTEAKGKIKNVQDARKFYKQAKKEKKELGEKLNTVEQELKDAREKLKAFEDAPKPDADKIAEQEKEVAQLRAEREFVKKQAEELEQRAAAYNVRDTEPFQRLVTKPLEKIGADLEELASAVSDEQGDQIAFMQAVGRVLAIGDPKARRKALEEVGAPLTSMQQGELIQLDKNYKEVMGHQAKLMENGKQALQIIKEKEEMDRRERAIKTAGEFKQGALEAREEMKKKYKFFERTDLPDDIKGRIQELEEAVEKIDPAKLPAKEVGKIVEAYYRGQILNDAASKHIAIMEKAEAKFKADLAEAQKQIEELKKNQKEAKAKEEAIDGTRPNLDSGGTNSDTSPRVDTIEGMVSNLFKV